MFSENSNFIYVSGIYSTISLDDSQEQIVRQLVRNQQGLGKDIDVFRQVVFWLMLVIGGYFWSAVTFIGKLQKERQKILIENNPILQKPLGL